MSCDHDIRVTHNDECVECTWQERERLRSEFAAAKDEIGLAARRIRVLRGTDVLATASSRGVVIWLKAILGGVSLANTDETRRHLRALIEVLEGNRPEAGD